MKNYIKPTIKVKTMKLKESMLAGSISMGVSDDPATEPAMSKSFFDGGNATGQSSSASTSNIWTEE
jgi:hypothetical protein